MKNKESDRLMISVDLWQGAMRPSASSVSTKVYIIYDSTNNIDAGGIFSSELWSLNVIDQYGMKVG